MARDGSTRGSAGKSFLILVLVLVVGVIGAAAGFYFLRYRMAARQRADLQSQNAELTKQLAAYKTDPNQAVQAEDDKTVAEVGKLYALPKDEKPIVAKVTDKEASKKQYGSFFDNAENNDVSLIYTKAKLAVLYRPSSKKIINVSTVTIQDKPTSAPALP